jgi:DNA invertase Pin-like site-specific DNA recombinase
MIFSRDRPGLRIAGAELIEQVTVFAGKAGAQFKSLREVWTDTTTPHGRLMVTMLAGIAEFERELIRARTGDGISRAKAAGVHMGRPPKLTKHQRQEVLARLDRGEETLTEIARSYAVSHMTILAVRDDSHALNALIEDQRRSRLRVPNTPSLLAD